MLEFTVRVSDEEVKDDDAVVCLKNEGPKSRRGFLFSLLDELNGEWTEGKRIRIIFIIIFYFLCSLIVSICLLPVHGEKVLSHFDLI